MKKNNLSILQFVGSLLVLMGAVLKFVELNFADYVFSGGVVILFMAHIFLMSTSKNEELRVQRAHRLMLLATFLLGAAAYFMFTGKLSWIPFVLAYAVISLYLSFRIK
ncbi:MAG: hypothetical protein QM751_10260 [Paludibacteraceae bacterium]